MAKSMANKTETTKESSTKKSTTKKASTESKSVKVESTESVEKVVVEAKPEKVFKPDDVIKCVSITHGELLMKGLKTNLMYRWANYGDETYVEYQDLFAAKTRRSSFIYSPLFMIEDDDLLADQRWKDVSDFYENMYSYNDINEILNTDNSSFREIISNAPKGLKKAIEIEIVTRLEAGTFDSLQKIKIVDEVCGTDLMCLVV